MSEQVQLYHGDCLSVLPMIEGESVAAIVTDPPYGMSYQSARRTDRTKRHRKIANDDQPFVWWLWDAFRVLKWGGALLCFCRWDSQEAFRQAMIWAGFSIRQHVVWDRDWHGMGDLRTSFAPQHDVIWQASKGRCELRGVRPRSVMRFRRLAADKLTHPNEKPVELMEHLISPVTDPDDLVLDCFMGSGVTGEAAIRAGRRFIGIELDDTYFAAASRRIEAAK